MNFSLYIAKRYVRSKSRTNVINIITYVAIVGIILGSASLLVVMSGFSGLKDYSLEFTNIADPDLKAEPITGKSFFISQEQQNQLDSLPQVAAFSKIIEEKVMISFDNKHYPAKIKGVDEHYIRVNKITPAVEFGNWFFPNSSQMVSGQSIANNLSFGVLDYGKLVALTVAKPGTGQITAPDQAFSTYNVSNVGIFNITPDLNETYVFTPINVTRELLNFEENRVSSIEFKLASGVTEDEARKKIGAILGNNIQLKNKLQLNSALYKMLNTENLAVYLIFTLVLIITMFNLIGALIMMILDKRKNLISMYNLGVTVKNLQRIFFYQGTLISVLGGFGGLVLGICFIILQQQFGFLKITPTMPYAMNLTVANILLVFVTISVLGIIASKIASLRVSNTLLIKSN